jgi:hypothetical protein
MEKTPKMDRLRAQREKAWEEMAATKRKPTKLAVVAAVTEAPVTKTIPTVSVTRNKGGRPKSANAMTGAERMRKLRAAKSRKS